VLRRRAPKATRASIAATAEGAPEHVDEFSVWEEARDVAGQLEASEGLEAEEQAASTSSADAQDGDAARRLLSTAAADDATASKAGASKRVEVWHSPLVRYVGVVVVSVVLLLLLVALVRVARRLRGSRQHAGIPRRRMV
jgi:hypothetical protein